MADNISQQDGSSKAWADKVNTRYGLDCGDLVLHVDGPQSLVHLVEDPLTLVAAASSVQTSYDDAVGAHQHRVPTEGELVAHRLATRGAVTVQRTDSEKKKGKRQSAFYKTELKLKMSIFRSFS